MKKRALVVSGGGSKGAFAVGAIRHMVDELGLSFEFISGTSTGSLIAPLVVTDELDELEEIYTTVTTRDVLIRRRLSDALRANSLFDVEPLWRLIDERLTRRRADAILASSVQLAITTVCLQTGRVTYFHAGPDLVHGEDVDAHRIHGRTELMRAVLASANQPVLMPPVQIPSGGEPVRQYVDGGVREFAPLKIAIDNGATEVYAVVLSPERPEVSEGRKQGLVSILSRTIGLFVEDVAFNDIGTARLYNEAIAYLDGVRARLERDFGLTDAQVDRLLGEGAPRNPFAGARAVELHLIRPEEPLPSDGLTFDPPVMRRMVELGRARAREVLGA